MLHIHGYGDALDAEFLLH